jgi:hypothetical protein
VVVRDSYAAVTEGTETLSSGTPARTNQSSGLGAVGGTIVGVTVKRFHHQAPEGVAGFYFLKRYGIRDYLGLAACMGAPGHSGRRVHKR